MESSIPSRSLPKIIRECISGSLRRISRISRFLRFAPCYTAHRKQPSSLRGAWNVSNSVRNYKTSVRSLSIRRKEVNAYILLNEGYFLKRAEIKPFENKERFFSRILAMAMKAFLRPRRSSRGDTGALLNIIT